jgi:hypothetical protein
MPGAEGQSRTADTVIFSYLAPTAVAQEGITVAKRVQLWCEKRVGTACRRVRPPRPPHRHHEPDDGIRQRGQRPAPDYGFVHCSGRSALTGNISWSAALTQLSVFKS